MQFCLHICLLCLPVVEYRLKAFVTHHGWTTLGGHYVCHVRQGDTWYHCNDSHVSKVNISSLPKRDGYFFLYESMQHSVEKCTEHQGVSGEHIQHYQHKDNEAGVEASRHASVTIQSPRGGGGGLSQTNYSLQPGLLHDYMKQFLKYTIHFRIGWELIFTKILQPPLGV